MSGTGFYVGSIRAKCGYKLIEATCSVCGKKFMRSDQHGYCAGGKYQCSYHCYRIPEEEERRNFREKLDKKLAAIGHSEETKNDASKKYRRSLEHGLEKARRRVEYCEAMVNMFTERVNRLPNGVKQRAEAMDSARRWRKNLKTAREEVIRIENDRRGDRRRAHAHSGSGGHAGHVHRRTDGDSEEHEHGAERAVLGGEKMELINGRTPEEGE